jgi:hypothetical protein
MGSAALSSYTRRASEVPTYFFAYGYARALCPARDKVSGSARRRVRPCGPRGARVNRRTEYQTPLALPRAGRSSSMARHMLGLASSPAITGRHHESRVPRSEIGDQPRSEPLYGGCHERTVWPATALPSLAPIPRRTESPVGRTFECWGAYTQGGSCVAKAQQCEQASHDESRRCSSSSSNPGRAPVAPRGSVWTSLEGSRGSIAAATFRRERRGRGCR